MSEYKLLQEYVVCLQRQNQAKNTERQTLYNEIQRLQEQLKSFEKQLYEAKIRAEQLGENQLSLKIKDLQQEIEILKYEQDHLFEENLSIVSQLQKNDFRILQLEKQNKELKYQKKELQKFRFTLQKISNTLESLQRQRCTLSEANYILIQQNSYLKGVIDNSKQQNSFNEQNQNQNQFKDRYLMMNSFQKISENDEEYEQSQEGDFSKSHVQRSVQNSSEKKSQQSQKSSNNKKQDALNNSSYLMMDDKSRQCLRLSLDKIGDQGQHVKNKSFSQKIESTSNVISYYNHGEQSCDVIQQIYEQISNELDQRNKSRFQSSQMIDFLKSKNYELQQKIMQYNDQFNKFLDEREYYQNRIQEMQRAEQYSLSQMQQKIQELLRNYELIEQENRRKDYQLEKMSNYTQRLEIENQKFIKRLGQYENLKSTKQSKKTKKRGGSQNNDIRQMKPELDSANQQLEQRQNIWENLDKETLIRQNNELIQKVNQLETQKSNLYQRLTQSQYQVNNDENQNPNMQYYCEESPVDLVYRQKNSIRLGISKKKSDWNGQKNEGRRSFSQYSRQQAKQTTCSLMHPPTIRESSQNKKERPSSNRNLNQGLKMRIDFIKQENLRLLKELEFN